MGCDESLLLLLLLLLLLIMMMMVVVLATMMMMMMTRMLLLLMMMLMMIMLMDDQSSTLLIHVLLFRIAKAARELMKAIQVMYDVPRDLFNDLCAAHTCFVTLFRMASTHDLPPRRHS